MDKTEIQSVLNLRSNDTIAKELADRQLAVILKGFQYLSNPTNSIIYIGDEVGLGKTYIAAGIAMLLRHYSNDVNNQRDVIIVPKKNLQIKWRKELNNFIQYNYLPANDIIKAQFQDNSVKNTLAPVNNAISIFRMSSFSALASPRNSKKELKDYLTGQMFSNDKLAIDTLNEAWQAGYFNNSNESLLRSIVAYLLNALSPKINCLIIDEAHNYKYGVGVDDHEESIRNEVTARFLGAVNDTKALHEFPVLKTRVKFPLAEKVICLSATPKDRSLLEIKNQFNCFINNHILSDAKSSEDVKSKLKSFFIRGNLNYTIQEKIVSRNQCRFEHRQGNINKDEIAIPLTVEDGFESIFWQLLQYKSIKHLNAKNNASFEIGMLAGFECYQLTADKQKVFGRNNENENSSIVDKEYDLLKSKTQKESQDYNIIKQLIDSYTDSFENELPPHPKQTKLENEIINQLNSQEKSLIFVRRIASAYELEKRILARYEKDIVVGKQLHLKGRYGKYNTPKLQSLLNDYYSKNTDEHRRELFNNLLRKVEINNYLFSKRVSINESEKQLWLETAYHYNIEFKDALKNFISFKKKNISQELKDITIKALEESYNIFISELQEEEGSVDDDIEDDDEDGDSGYFFSNYFKKGNNGFKYRSKMYRENWFEINILLLNNEFPFITYDGKVLESRIDEIDFADVKKKHQAFQKKQIVIYRFLEENSKKEISSKSENLLSDQLMESTFLTQLLLKFCSDEMKIWINKRVNNSRVGHQDIIKDVLVLNAILKAVFRNGTGLLPGFIADSAEGDFSELILDLIKEEDSPFRFLLNEIKTIIRDFDLIVSNNFEDKDENKITSYLKNLSPVVGTTGQDKRDRGMLAAQFRMPGFPYVLVTTDIFREGEDLHCYCQNIYHYGIAWNPSDMEQRTGRIDRINSLSYRKLIETNKLLFDNMVQVFYPYLTQSVEVNQVIELLKNINKFIETFNDIEIENKYESSVSLDREISKSDIPEQIKNRLKSLYDVSDFQA